MLLLPKPAILNSWTLPWEGHEKKLSFFSIALLMPITACNQGSPQYSTGETCTDIGCASISIEHPIQAMKPVKVIIRVQLTQIKGDLHILLLSENLQSFDFELPPEATEDGRNEINAGWEIVNPEVNKEYIFQGMIILTGPAKTRSFELWNWHIGGVHSRHADARRSKNIFGWRW